MCGTVLKGRRFMLKCGFLSAIFYLMLLREQNAMDLISLFLSLVKLAPAPLLLFSYKIPPTLFFSMLGQERANPWQLVASPHPYCSSGFGDQCPCDVHYIALKLHIKVCHGRAAKVR